ncbi:hypothetical protein CA265_16105 [Sphingobacteriaceae bacterium GW460-11-11-14-LB5]|nr:hypothetical protein CA265_16105 [Sphingobacteriaceae bacterium GW460-11-11-14-LB5]
MFINYLKFFYAFCKAGFCVNRLDQSCFPFYPDEKSGCSFQSGLFYLGLPLANPKRWRHSRAGGNLKAYALGFPIKLGMTVRWYYFLLNHLLTK